MEAEYGYVAFPTDVPAAEPRPRHMSSVQDQSEPVPPAQCFDLLELTGIASQTDEYDGARPRADLLCNGLGVEAEMVVDIGEDGSQSLVKDRMVGRDERQWSADDLVAFFPAVASLQDEEREVQAGACGIQEVRVRELRITLPRRLKLEGLEAESRPPSLEALANLGQGLLDTESRREQMNRLYDSVSIR